MRSLSDKLQPHPLALAISFALAIGAFHSARAEAGEFEQHGHDLAGAEGA